MAHRLRQTSIIFRQVEILLAHRRSKWTNSEAAAQATTTAAAADQAADHCKAFPKPLRVGFWRAAILTRCERGPNEVRNQILGDWPPKSPDRLFGSHTLSHSFQNSKTQELSAVEQKRNPSQAAAAGKS